MDFWWQETEAICNLMRLVSPVPQVRPRSSFVRHEAQVLGPA
jgi:hypothetical protein